MRIRARIFVGMLAAALLLTASSGNASATAVGSTPIGTFEYEIGGVTVKMPTGCFLNHYISGEGLDVVKQNATTVCVGLAATSKYCHWRMDLTYEDVEGRTYLSSPGEIQNTCDYTAGRYESNRRTLSSYGKACARFFVYNVERAVMCHNVVK